MWPLLKCLVVLTGATGHQLPWHSHLIFRYGWQGDITPTPAAPPRGQANSMDTNVNIHQSHQVSLAEDLTGPPRMLPAQGMTQGRGTPGLDMGSPHSPSLFLFFATDFYYQTGWPAQHAVIAAIPPQLPILWLPISIGAACNAYSTVTPSQDDTE